MSACAESIESITISTVIPRYSCFQESLDHFVAEFEPIVGRFGGKTGEWCEEDCISVYHRDGDATKIDFPADSWEWF
jgi:hypothetical protein